MRPWIKRSVIGLFSATVLMGGLSACGHPGAGMGRGQTMSAEDQGKMRERMVERISSRLELDSAQKQKLDALASKLQEQRNALRGASDPRVDIQSLVSGEKFDRSKAQAMINERTTLVQGKSPEVVAALGDFYDSLRPAQQAKVREFMQKGRGWRQG